jgi:hypothetical protein
MTDAKQSLKLEEVTGAVSALSLNPKPTVARGSKTKCSVSWLLENDDNLKADAAWQSLRPKYEGVVATDAGIEQTKAALERRGHRVTIMDSPAAALALLSSGAMLPQGASVAFGGSITLEEIGFLDFVKQRSDLKNYRTEAFAAAAKGDQALSFQLRSEGMAKADLFFSSLSAVTEDGVMISADASGTRVGALSHGAKQVVLVLGANKIVPDLNAGLERLYKWIVPLESAHMREVFKIPGTAVNNISIIYGSMMPRFHIIIVKNHSLGY